MERTELYVWIAYGCFVLLGLLVFITISCIVRAKNKSCEAERAFVRAYNERVAKEHASIDNGMNDSNDNKDVMKNASKTPYKKESFSLFNLLS